MAEEQWTSMLEMELFESRVGDTTRSSGCQSTSKHGLICHVYLSLRIMESYYTRKKRTSLLDFVLAP